VHACHVCELKLHRIRGGGGGTQPRRSRTHHNMLCVVCVRLLAGVHRTQSSATSRACVTALTCADVRPSCRAGAARASTDPFTLQRHATWACALPLCLPSCRTACHCLPTATCNLGKCVVTVLYCYCFANPSMLRALLYTNDTAQRRCRCTPECPPATVQYVLPTNAAEFSVQSNTSAQQWCADRTHCGCDEYEVSPPTPTVDRMCRQRTECVVGSSYETVQPTATTDRQCNGSTTCAANQYVGSPHPPFVESTDPV
jgi:hypothetical protein